MTRFYLIRHGEKDTPQSVLAARSPGVRLTAFGRRQAEAIAERLASEPVHRVYASPMERAQETAAPLARARGVPVEVLEAVHEYHFGEWTNRTTESLEGDPSWKNFNGFRSGTPTPGGELMLAIQARFVGAMLSLRDKFPDQGIALFSHGDPVRAALLYFAGSPMDFWSRFEISVGSITTIELGASHVRILKVNDVPLPLGAG